MKKRFLPAVGLALLLACNNATTTTTAGSADTSATDSPAATAATTPPDSAAITQAFINFSTTGPMHQMLAKEVGNWTEEATMWMAPGAPPAKMKSTSSVSMIMGGRYQQAKHTGSMDGMPFEGMSTIGYDNATKKFINTWIDNFGTGVLYLEGDYDSTARTIHFTGKQTDIVTGKQANIKQDITFHPDGTQTMAMYAPPIGGGAEYKTMEMVMKRK